MESQDVLNRLEMALKLAELKQDASQLTEQQLRNDLQKHVSSQDKPTMTALINNFVQEVSASPDASKDVKLALCLYATDLAISVLIANGASTEVPSNMCKSSLSRCSQQCLQLWTKCMSSAVSSIVSFHEEGIIDMMQEEAQSAGSSVCLAQSIAPVLGNALSKTTLSTPEGVQSIQTLTDVVASLNKLRWLTSVPEAGSLLRLVKMPIEQPLTVLFAEKTSIVQGINVTVTGCPDILSLQAHIVAACEKEHPEMGFRVSDLPTAMQSALDAEANSPQLQSECEAPFQALQWFATEYAGVNPDHEDAYMHPNALYSNIVPFNDRQVVVLCKGLDQPPMSGFTMPGPIPVVLADLQPLIIDEVEDLASRMAFANTDKSVARGLLETPEDNEDWLETDEYLQSYLEGDAIGDLTRSLSDVASALSAGSNTSELDVNVAEFVMPGTMPGAEGSSQSHGMNSKDGILDAGAVEFNPYLNPGAVEFNPGLESANFPSVQGLTNAMEGVSIQSSAYSEQFPSLRSSAKQQQPPDDDEWEDMEEVDMQ